MFLETDESVYLEFALKYGEGVVPEYLVGNEEHQWSYIICGKSYFVGKTHPRFKHLIKVGNSYGWSVDPKILPFDGLIGNAVWESFHQDYPDFIKILQKENLIVVDNIIVTRNLSEPSPASKKLNHTIKIEPIDKNVDWYGSDYYIDFFEYQTNNVEKIRENISIKSWREFLEKYRLVNHI